MKLLSLLLPLLLLNGKSPENIQKNTAAAPTVKLTCILEGCKSTDKVSLYSFEGISFRRIQAAQVSGDTFRFELPASSPRFLYVGTSETQKRAVIIGQEPLIRLKGKCNSMQRVKTEVSDLNLRYESFRNTNQALKGKMNQSIRSYQRNYRDEEKRQKAEVNIRQVDTDKIALLDSLQKTQPFIAKIMALESYVSYITDKKGYANEVEHYIKEYFSGVDLTDEAYNHIPPLFEAFKTYAQTLTSTNLPLPDFKNFVDLNLNKIPEGTPAYNYALGGVILGLQAKNHPAFLEYGQRFVDLHKDNPTPPVQRLAQQIKQAGQFLPGAVAPDFTQNTPEGEPLSLSSLRGKVVLVDFWASWCGPCRKENPNVVKVYEKYKDKGFDILGVSLDKDKKRWLNAIDKDGLPWHHVSDLRGWSNSVAQTYSVRSIPHTVLLDREGRIIARNLRGAQLEQQLAKIFGE